MHSSKISVFALLLLLFPSASFAQITLEIETAFDNLSFADPVDIQHAGDGTNRLFVVEQHLGRIQVFDNDKGVASAQTFLQLPPVNSGFEEGLLGLAFHPDYETNGYFFVYYSASNPRRSVVSRFSVDQNNPNAADPNSELIIMEIGQPFGNHNGGQLAFSPFDGYLYIGLGDGGDAGDPQDHGENPETLLGSMLRIDVNNASESTPYQIPADNPFANNSEEYREEIFAYGLRNPWRFSIDPETGDIWAGDVGQGTWEEIDIIINGGNYGWDIMEGNHCYEPSSGCDQTGRILPVWEYRHQNSNVSVTGGHVYRGSRIPEIAGKYIYADYASGRIWALTKTNTDTTNIEIADAWFNISAFGVSENNELFIVGYNGTIYRFVETQSTANENPELPEIQHELGESFPNPFTGHTTIPFTLTEPADIELAVFDLLGRKVGVLAKGRYTAGNHSAVWSDTSTGGAIKVLPGGAYLFTLRVHDKIVATRVATLVK